jgi:type II secretory pathway component PulF
MKIHYKAQAKIGVIIEDTIESVSKEAVVEKIRERGATPILVEEVKKGGMKIPIPFIDNLLGSISLQDRVIFSKNLARMLQAGLSMTRALQVLKKQTTKKKLANLFDTVIQEIAGGGTLSSGLQKFPKVFSPIFIAMVHAGEESGKIPENLLEVSNQLDKTYKLRKKIKGAMMYPGVIVTAMLIIGILMFIFVIPTLLDTFKDFNLDLPMSTKIVIFVSDTLQAHTVLFLGGIVAFVSGGIAALRAPSLQKYIDLAILKLPLVGTMAKELNAALATRTLASLLGSGLSVSRALEITKEVIQNTRYKTSFDDGLKYIEQGAQLSKVFQERTDLYPVMVGEMIEVGEETGKIVDMLQDVALFYEDEVDAKTKNLSTIIEPVLMIFIGVAVGFFAVSMMSPMYSLVGGI